MAPPDIKKYPSIVSLKASPHHFLGGAVHVDDGPFFFFFSFFTLKVTI
jgi:hypothetical protein